MLASGLAWVFVDAGVDDFAGEVPASRVGGFAVNACACGFSWERYRMSGVFCRSMLLVP